MTAKPTTETLHQQLRAYLRSEGGRCTEERLRVLDAAYAIDGPFDMEQLAQQLRGMTSLHVCQATLYNTLVVLQQARLVMRHPTTAGGRRRFEASRGQTKRGYTLCDVCGRLTPLPPAALGDWGRLMKTPLFHVESYVAYAHGVCNQCAARKSRRKTATGRGGPTIQAKQSRRIITSIPIINNE